MHSIELINVVLILLLSTKITPQKILELPYTEFIGSFYTAILIGDPYQVLFEGINLAHPFTLTTNFTFKTNASSTIQIMDNEDPSFNIDTKTFEGTRLIDKVTLPKSLVVIEGFSFYTIENHRYDHNKRRTGISLANKFTKSSFSLVHLLKEKNHISHLSFAIVPNRQHNDKGLISFGGINEEAIMNKSITKCQVDDREPYITWSCRLSYVFIGELSYDRPSDNIYYHNKDYAYFQTSTKMIIAPNKFIAFLYKKVFNQLIKEEKCILQEKNRCPLVCTVDSITLMPNISFVFDHIAYSFKPTEYFECLLKSCDLQIIPNEDESWIFGTIFIRKFVMNFDYEDNMITLYSNETRTAIAIDDLIPIRYWMWCCVILVSVIIFLYAYYAFIQKKKSRMNVGGKHHRKFIEKEYQNI